MASWNMTRRSFVKTAAVSAAVAAVAGAASPTAALAENENAATTESAVTHPLLLPRLRQGGVAAWGLRPGRRVIRTEGDEDCFLTMGNHCSKGQASIQAAYHPDRIWHPHEAHEPWGDDDPGWAFPGRGLPDHRRQHPGDHREVRVTSPPSPGAAPPPVVHAVRRRHGVTSVRHAEHRGCLPGVQGRATSCQPYRQRAGLVLVRADQPLHEVRAVGHRAVAVELRRRRHTVVDVARCADAFISAPAPDEPGTYRQVLAAAAPRHRQRAGARLVPPHPEERPVRLVQFLGNRWSNSPFIVVPDMDPTGYEEHVQNGGCPTPGRPVLLTEADIDPTMVDWGRSKATAPQRYLVFDRLNNRWTYWQAHPGWGEAHWGGRELAKSTSYFDQDLSVCATTSRRSPARYTTSLSSTPLIDPAK